MVRTCSAIRFTRAIRRKSGIENSGWIKATLWIFKKVWNDDTMEFTAQDGSRWNGIGRWSVNDKPWPIPEVQSTPEPEPDIWSVWDREDGLERAVRSADELLKVGACA
jgi:hypothetical protein